MSCLIWSSKTTYGTKIRIIIILFLWLKSPGKNVSLPDCERVKCCLKYFIIHKIRWVVLKGSQSSSFNNPEANSRSPSLTTVCQPSRWWPGRHRDSRLDCRPGMPMLRAGREATYRRGRQLSGHPSGSPATACFPERGRYPGCRWAPLLWTPPLVRVGMSEYLRVLLTVGLHTYRCIPNYFLLGRRRV